MRIKRAAAAMALVPFAAAGLGWLYQRAGLQRDARRYPPQGLLLSRRGRYLHVLRQGSGQPAVIFEAGLAASSISWARVQPLAAAFSSTASYDRAGLGWSTPLRSQLSLAQMIDDLHAVVAWAGDGEPVVLVGHSFGALLLLAYTRRFPERVAGLVMVEPVSLLAWSETSAASQHRLQVGASLSRRGAVLAEFGIVRAALALLLHGGQRWSHRIGRHAAGAGAATLERLTGEVSKLPQELWPVIAAQWSRSQSFQTMAKALEALPMCAADVGRPALPADLPVAILSAASATQEELRERDGWLMGLVETRHLVLPETGHWLHLERPEDVAEAIRWCAERAQLRA
ncbi:MAG TPA: alpha/beta hydrolase [Acidobacteriaceae bacterium]|nr:alpha/beta hydrolase [Acidobacteriaceae bacterium]